jgi:hypothetical protein
LQIVVLRNCKKTRQVSVAPLFGEAIRRVTNEESVKQFICRTEDGDLNFYFGDEATHAGSFTFQHGITGKLAHTWAWPVAQTIAILNLDGDKTVSITDQGAMKISVNSGMATYDYILPAQQK